MTPQARQFFAVAMLAGGAVAFVATQPPRAPKPGAPEVAAVVRPAPAVRSTDHRKVHKQAPKIAKRKWEPVPGVRPIPPIAKEEKRRERPKVKREAKLNCSPKGRGLAPCSVIRACRAQMSAADQMAAYFSSTSEQVAHGRRCLGL